MIPINLVLFQMSKLVTSLPVIWLVSSDLKHWLEKSGLVPLNEQRTTDPGSRLVDPVDDEDVEEIVHEQILQLWQCDLKKMEEY
jgi:hypothetical protein